MCLVMVCWLSLKKGMCDVSIRDMWMAKFSFSVWLSSDDGRIDLARD